ncbi:MAG: hypothetical protein J6A53_05320 [Clostridia bacterium]|nr:hypothetical protein [Clostridia bacterium]
MNRYSNHSDCNEYSQNDCQCPYRDTCQRYGYRNNNYYDNDRSERRSYHGRECNSCSICNIFRRCNH